MSDKDETEIVDSEEEDYEIYFLQPASSPYNIKEKLETANKALFDEDNPIYDRPLMVKFKEELVDYEPDLTDDDVQSIESYNEVDYLLEQELIKDTMSSDSTHKIELNIFTPKLNITEEEEETDDEDDEVEEEDEVDDSIDDVHEDQNQRDVKDGINDEGNEETEQSFGANGSIENEIDEQIDSESYYGDNCSDHVVEISNSSSSISNRIISDYEAEDVIHSDDTESKSKSGTKTLSSTPSKRISPISRSRKLSKVDCKSHCIERLDTQLDFMVKKLQINERPVCPTLKLIKRKCCDENPAKNEFKLPCYSGLRSEYGLSLKQLEKRQRRKELKRIREETRNRLMDEFKSRKIQQNEAIFAQWLKNLQKRKEDVTKMRGKITSKELDTSNKGGQKLTRPKTCCYPVRSNSNTKRGNRPRTSPACVFIEVPRAVLKKGLQIGNVIVTSTRNISSDQSAHILSIS